MRLACIHVPDLALQAALRRTPDRRGTPVVITDRPRGATDVVVAASTEARAAGVRIGLTATQATALCPAVFRVALSPGDIAAAEAALADIGFAFAPRIQNETARVFIDVGDLAQSATGIAQAIVAQAARVGLGVRVAIAGSKSVARIATRARELITIAPGREAAFLAPLPVRMLGSDLAPEISRALERWGITTLGELAALPASEVALRLGATGARLVRLARGTDDEPFVPHWPQESLEESVDLEYGITELEPLAFVLRGLLDRLLARLGVRALACAGLTLRLKLESSAFDVRTIHVAAPTRELSTLLQLIRLDLARRPPEAPIVEVLIGAEPARARAAQMDFLRPAGPAPDRLAATIARLAALVGPENVGSPRPENSWREEAMTIAAFKSADNEAGSRRAGKAKTTTTTNDNAERDAGDGATNDTGNGAATPLTIRRFRPAEEVEVMLGPAGPTALRGRDTTAHILIAAGPYRLSGEWWRVDEARAQPERSPSREGPGTLPGFPSDRSDKDGGGFSRDYWDVHASDGAVYRVHQDRRTGRWYLDGYYD